MAERKHFTDIWSVGILVAIGEQGRGGIIWKRFSFYIVEYKWHETEQGFFKANGGKLEFLVKKK